MFKDALKTLERKLGQPQAVVSAHLDKRSSSPPLKMYNSDNIITILQQFQALLGFLNHFHMTQTLRAPHSLHGCAKAAAQSERVLFTLHSEETLG